MHFGGSVLTCPLFPCLLADAAGDCSYFFEQVKANVHTEPQNVEGSWLFHAKWEENVKLWLM